ncbi:dTMP kinase [Terasakiella pusilla]|uniref:dTMP kinase n=1 Tax=Terasakiella pusilla TaxID=64973 RepID=UPI003AA8592B
MQDRGQFIVFEGVDGSGKSTQIKTLEEKLSARGIKYKRFHYPKTEDPISGKLVSMFLRGEFGTVENVNPYLVALMFAFDRYVSKHEIEELLEQGVWVISDRYVLSNVAFQCAKMKTEQEKNELADWINKVEFEKLDLPSPDLSVLFKVPVDHVLKVLEEERDSEDREYLQGQSDIHEKSTDLQKNVAIEYEKLHTQVGNSIEIDCIDENGKMKLPATISHIIEDRLIQMGLLDKLSN